MSLSLHVENFRVIASADWTLDGVCALVGPNGAGKSTLLQAFEFLQTMMFNGPEEATKNAGGAAFIRHLDAAVEADVILDLKCAATRWELRARTSGAGLQLPLAERLWHDGQIVVEQPAGAAEFTAMGRGLLWKPGTSAILTAIGQRNLPPLGLEPLVCYQYFHDLQLQRLRANGSQNGTDHELASSAENLFTVLRNWQAGERKHRERLEFVKGALAEAFPDLFEDLDFEAAGQTVSARFYRPGSASPIPIHAAPNGLLAGLSHLTAIASCEEHALVGIDEIENSLHPHAVCVIVDAIRGRAAQKDLTVVLATHSPVVLNQFNGDPSHVFVLEAGRSPIRLDQHDNPDWLVQFSLGDLYANEDIGAPAKRAT